MDTLWNAHHIHLDPGVPTQDAVEDRDTEADGFRLPRYLLWIHGEVAGETGIQADGRLIYFDSPEDAAHELEELAATALAEARKLRKLSRSED